MIRKSILPLPLILLIPIVLLVVVVIAGVYRFNLSDEELMAKFPRSQAQSNEIVKAVLGFSSRNPWTIQVPEQGAVTFLDEWDKENGYLIGQYDSGSTKGRVVVPITLIAKREVSHVSWIVAPMIVTTQGSGVFNYIGLFKFDPVPSRVVLVDDVFVGDRIRVTQMAWENDTTVTLTYQAHSNEQVMADTPKQSKALILRRLGSHLKVKQE